MNERPSFRIAAMRSANDLTSTVRLFRAYASSLDIDLSYQDFEAEVESMPGSYAPPAGELLLARYPNDTPVGCVGLRPIGLASSRPPRTPSFRMSGRSGF